MEENEIYAEKLIDRFDDIVESGNEIGKQEVDEIASLIPSSEVLKATLPRLLDKALDIAGHIDECDKKIKEYQSSKKTWTLRDKSYKSVLGAVIERLNIAGATVRANGVKLSTSSRTSYELDEDWMISLYRGMVDALQQQLPSYIKLEIKVDKNELASFIKTDSSMLVDFPDKIHTKVTRSTSIK